MSAISLLLALAAQPMPTAEGAPAPVCLRQQPVAGFENWGKGVAAVALTAGRPAALKLQPAAGVNFQPPLGRPAKDGTFGGSFALHVDRADYYRIALSAGAWIDVIQSGHPLSSAAHMHGPACSGIAKIVTFQLQPGDYVVQLSEAKADGMLAMVVTGYGERKTG